MKSIKITFILFIALSLLITTSDGGLLGWVLSVCGGYTVCQTACNAGWVTCYAAAGLTAGTITAGLGAPAAALACNAIQGTCMATCAAVFIIA